MVSTSNLAKLNKLHYKIDKYNKTEATERINNRLKGTGYKLHKIKRGIAQYKHDDGHNVISVKGTNIKNYKDIMSDISLGLGLSKYDSQFKSRRNKIKDILRENKGQENYLTGHSLGSSILTSSMVKSKSIRDNIKEAHGFNTGYSGLFNKELQKGLEGDEKKILKKKLTHHHTKGDILSHSLTDDAVGEVKIYNTEAKTPIKIHSLDNFEGGTFPPF